MTSPDSAGHGAKALGSRLGAAACLLLAAGVPAHAAGSDADSTWRFEGTGLFYGEQGRTNVIEPMARITRLFPDGQTLSAQVGIDAMTGASPTGAIPSGTVHTTTSPSGRVSTSSATEVPTSRFNDLRGVLDLEWMRPFAGIFTETAGAHFSRERDYQSLGGSAVVTIDLMQRLTTLSLGGSFNRDDVVPIGGTPLPLSDGTDRAGPSSDSKRVTTSLVGVSRILTRRWMVAVNGSRTVENGYLTEPYKIISILDRQSGLPVGQLTESRPGSRDRKDVLASSVYHLAEDVLYTNYRYYWDDWGVRSHAIDLKYRHDLEDGHWVQPHIRVYTQTAARFFRFGLVQGSQLPGYVTGDERLGPLRTLTLGATYGFHTPDYPGEFFIRGEYLRQWGNGHPKGAIGKEREIDLFPPVAIGSLLVGYSVEF